MFISDLATDKKLLGAREQNKYTATRGEMNEFIYDTPPWFANPKSGLHPGRA